MNRREFSKLSAMTLAAAQLQAQAPSTKPVGFAAVGLGTISNIFMSACAKSDKAKIVGLVTGHPAEKGSKYSAMYNVPQDSIYTYDTFDHIRDNPDMLADIACVALNRLPPRYIRHDVDFAFFQTDRERSDTERSIAEAVEFAFGFVQARNAMRARA